MSEREPGGLTRLLRPRSVAVVGASENQTRARSAVPALLASDAEVYLIHPRPGRQFGQQVLPDLRAIGKPVDAVFALVNAANTVGVVADAASTGAGGVVVQADGFGQPGPDGAPLADALVTSAGRDLALLGPNCNGYIDAVRGVRMSGAPLLPLLAGPVGVVTHSGALIGSIGAAGADRGVGFSHLISTGNELRIGIAECVDFLVDDPATEAIALVVETLRRPGDFFAAVLRARAADKPVLVLKLGRSERSRRIARSHTGAVTGPGWVYQEAFAQHGMLVATDVADLADQLVCFTQLPRRRWTAVDGLAVLGTSGGWASLAADVAEQEGLALPPLDRLGDELRDIVPDAGVSNPLDMSGAVVSNRAAVRAVSRAYGASPEVDTLLFLWFVDDAGLDMGGPLVDAAAAAGEDGPKAVMLTSIEDSRIGPAAAALPGRGVAVSRGIRSAMRSLAAMRAHVTARDRELGVTSAAVPRLPVPREVVASEAGPMLAFGAAMTLLAAHGIEVAPYSVIGAAEEPDAVPLPPAGSYVVKLADVPHRTDIGAVRLRVAREAVPSAVRELRELAASRGMPLDVAVQAQVRIDGEVLVGADTTSELGPFVACGLGGTLVEVAGRPSGALAPVTLAQAHQLLGSLAGLGVFDGLRGQRPWDRLALAETVASVSRLAAGSSEWLATLEINPLAATEGRFVAVDCLCLLRPDAPEAPGQATARAGGG
ncbi:MAG TPA: acetate--CoA ligase family protein [Trebonia sp.]|nr:acetate--CoA ligase family protein [Trebonia sp.]